MHQYPVEAQPLKDDKINNHKLNITNGVKFDTTVTIK